jgi:hypothetical protein
MRQLERSLSNVGEPAVIPRIGLSREKLDPGRDAVAQITRVANRGAAGRCRELGGRCRALAPTVGAPRQPRWWLERLAVAKALLRRGNTEITNVR